MAIVAGTFTSQKEARCALRDLEKKGIAPVKMNLIDPDDRKGFEREHRPTRTALRRGALVGLIFGLVVFGALLKIAGVNLAELRFIALYLSGIALCTAGWAAIFACWNMGVSHDEALLYEEAKQNRTIIAAIEVDEPAEERVRLELGKHGALNIRSGNWQPQGWTHTRPNYTEAL